MRILPWVSRTRFIYPVSCSGTMYAEMYAPLSMHPRDLVGCVIGLNQVPRWCVTPGPRAEVRDWRIAGVTDTGEVVAEGTAVYRGDEWRVKTICNPLCNPGFCFAACIEYAKSNGNAGRVATCLHNRAVRQVDWEVVAGYSALALKVLDVKKSIMKTRIRGLVRFVVYGKIVDCETELDVKEFEYLVNNKRGGSKGHVLKNCVDVLRDRLG